MLALRDKYQSKQPFRWQEIQDVGQQVVKHLFCKGKFQHLEDHGFVLFLCGIFHWHVSIATVVGNATIA